jgi:aspartyl protease family protein
VLSQKDAVKLGLNPDKLTYFGRALTANGEVRTAPVRLDTVAIGPYNDRNLSAVVNAGDLGQSLLGMNYLQRWSRIEISDGKLTLSR